MRTSTIGLNNLGGLGALWVAAATAVWVGLVPHAVSPNAFVWGNAVLFVTTTAGILFLRSLAPTRSIAHILYDAEQESRDVQAPPVRR
jgi:hypothetical protein